MPLRIHAILDDYSRHIMARQACSTEREMLALLTKAVRVHGTPEVLYLEYVPGHIFEILFPISLCLRRRPKPDPFPALNEIYRNHWRSTMTTREEMVQKLVEGAGLISPGFLGVGDGLGHPNRNIWQPGGSYPWWRRAQRAQST